ncbi:MAG: Phosphoglycolate phosphatase [Candidatus Heimdallarchaeota archaeon LC_3]|nr:MAG: Phosphoglycolate phosphatase [Candidatus Heimdallarchaeota archaeon LC_3]
MMIMPESELFGFKSTLMFDFDNTLLLMDEDKFIKTYFSLVAKKFEKEIPLEDFFRYMSQSTLSMTSNKEQKMTNDEKFLKDFELMTKIDREVIISRFSDFYLKEFSLVQNVTKPHPFGFSTIEKAMKKGYKIVIASNPFYPEMVSDIRLGWAGLENFKNDIALITTSDLMHFTKPDINYYKEILELIDEKPENCIMIGNDYLNDGIASVIGIDVFLLDGTELNNSMAEPHFLDEESKRLVGNKKFDIRYSGTLKYFFESL